MAAAAPEAGVPTGALWGLVQDFVMGQQDGPAEQVVAGMIMFKDFRSGEAQRP